MAAAMRARTFWKAVTVDRSNLLDRFLALMHERRARYCLVGGQAVNAYVDPVVSLDLNIVIAAEDLERLEPLLSWQFRVDRSSHSLNLTAEGSDLRIQIQTDPRYAEFLDHAASREVLGLELPVASVDDVLRGKIWAAEDPARRGSKQQKNLADIARLLEKFPTLRDQVPASVLKRLI
jgi:hypothetical protein